MRKQQLCSERLQLLYTNAIYESIHDIWARQKGRREKARRAKRAKNKKGAEQKGLRTKSARDHDVASPLHSRS